MNRGLVVEGLAQLVALLRDIWREHRCRHVWSDEHQEPAGCVRCGRSRL